MIETVAVGIMVLDVVDMTVLAAAAVDCCYSYSVCLALALALVSASVSAFIAHRFAYTMADYTWHAVAHVALVGVECFVVVAAVHIVFVAADAAADVAV